MYVQDKERASVYIYEWEWYCQYETSLSKLHASLQVMSMLIRSNGAAVPGAPSHLSGFHHQNVGATSSPTKFSFVSQRPGGIAEVENSIRFVSPHSCPPSD